MRRLCSAALLAAVMLAGCGGLRTVRGPDGLRTWASDSPVLCDLGRYLGPPLGTLAGAPDDSERAWIVTPDGGRLSVTWPSGFTVRFEPDAALHGPGGRLVARAGDSIDANQGVPEKGATPDHPLFVTWVNGVCFGTGPT